MASSTGLVKLLKVRNIQPELRTSSLLLKWHDEIFKPPSTNAHTVNNIWTLLTKSNIRPSTTMISYSPMTSPLLLETQDGHVKPRGETRDIPAEPCIRQIEVGGVARTTNVRKKTRIRNSRFVDPSGVRGPKGNVMEPCSPDIFVLEPWSPAFFGPEPWSPKPLGTLQTSPVRSWGSLPWCLLLTSTEGGQSGAARDNFKHALQVSKRVLDSDVKVAIVIDWWRRETLSNNSGV